MKNIKKYILWLLLGILTGVICGLLGSVFSKTIGFFTNIRTENTWILYLLPFAGLLSVLIYKVCNVSNIGTVSFFESVQTEQTISPLLLPAIFSTTCISHLFGASSGREGAALQIGGSVANTISKIFKLDEETRHITIMCGMAALFSAVFGTPLAAWCFVLEVILTRLCLTACIPVLLSSMTAFGIATLLHIHPERFNIGTISDFSFLLIIKVLAIAVVGIVVAFIFCKGLCLGINYAKKIFKNEYLRILAGGVVIVALTLLVGCFDYNGGGVDIIERVFEGTVKYEAFALKMLFTIICVSVGYKGGEIIPTLFIGATLGGSLATVLNLPVGFGAAVGMAVLFVCATKCPFATILLCGEMFGFSCLPLIAPVIIISFVVARYQGLYENTKDLFTLIKEQKKA